MGAGRAFEGRFPVLSPSRIPAFHRRVELRGEIEVDHGLAAQDAKALVNYLTHAGHIAGPVAPLPEARCAATPLDGVEPLTAPHAGISVFFKSPGDAVRSGGAIGEVIDPLTDLATPWVASVSGTITACVSRRDVVRHMRVGKIAGTTAYRTGNLLSM